MLLAQDSELIVTANESAAAANEALVQGTLMWPLFAAFMGLSFLIAIVFIVVLVFRHLRNNRELLNAERVKAIEAGQPLDTLQPDENSDKFQHHAFWISFWVGGALPIAAFMAASGCVTEGRINDGMSLFLIWSGAVTAAVAGVIGATMIMLAAAQRNRETEKNPPDNWEAGRTQQYDNAGSV